MAEEAAKRRRSTSNDGDDTEQETKRAKVDKAVRRLPKRNYALCFGYLGEGFYGMQAQGRLTPGVEPLPTVEGELEKVLFSLGTILETNYNNFYRTKWSRVARTDRGVHAACQVVAARLVIPIDESLPERPAEQSESSTNLLLAEGERESPSSNYDCQVLNLFQEKLAKGMEGIGLKLFKIERVSKNFCARTLCGRRRYAYIIPVKYALPFEISERLKKSDAYKYFFEMTPEEQRSVDTSKLETKERVIKGEDIKEGDPKEKLSSDEVEDLRLRLETLMQDFVGSHFFHNFTNKKKNENEAQLRRVIEHIQIKSHTIDGEQFFAVEITGQSFLLNQIRKMVSLAVEIIKGSAPLSAIRDSLKRGNQRQTHLVPAEGLFLDMVWFNRFDKRQRDSSPEFNLEDIEEKIEDFKASTIIPRVVRDLVERSV